MNKSKKLEIIEKVISWHYLLLEKLIDEDTDAQYTLIAEAIIKLKQAKRAINAEPRGM